MKPELDDLDPMEDPEAVLEMMLINQYLKSQGYSYKDLSQLPCEVARKLMIEASRFASSRLAEISARTKFKDEIHRPGGES